MTCARQGLAKMRASTNTCQRSHQLEGEIIHGMNKSIASCLAEIKTRQLCYDVLVQRAGLEKIGKLFVKCCFGSIGSVECGFFR